MSTQLISKGVRFLSIVGMTAVLSGASVSMASADCNCCCAGAKAGTEGMQIVNSTDCPRYCGYIDGMQYACKGDWAEKSCPMVKN